jgi:hypothetical protein
MHWQFFTFSSPLPILGIVGNFFIGEPTLASIPPLLWAMGEGIIFWIQALLNPTPSFPFFFLLLQGGAISTSFSTISF